jgi:hypothetical protein
VYSVGIEGILRYTLESMALVLIGKYGEEILKELYEVLG